MGVVSKMSRGRQNKTPRKIWFFGHFGSGNFGNEITLQTILHEVRLRFPKCEVACICTAPQDLEASQRVKGIALNRGFVKPWKVQGGFSRLLRWALIGLPSELRRWLEAFAVLKGGGMLLIPGTGLLTDAFGTYGWGPSPYNLFRWCLVARLRGCTVLFVSVGAGPVYGKLGRCFIKAALCMARYRSYRDDASKAYLEGIGILTKGDRVYPDLVFSSREFQIVHNDDSRPRSPIVGLGLMTYAGKYSVENPRNGIYTEYLRNLAAFAAWLLARDYAIRLLIGEVEDRGVSTEFKRVLRSSFGPYDEERIIDQPARSAEELVPQIASTAVVVATRFHNLVLALALNRPVIAISFHHKCAALMSEMGLGEYCHDINNMNADKLIEQFQNAERNAGNLKLRIRQRVEQLRGALDEQYRVIFSSI